MKIGEAHRTQSSSLYSVNTIGALVHPAPIGVADRTQKKNIGALCLVSIAYWCSDVPRATIIGAPMPPCAITNGAPNVEGHVEGRKWFFPEFQPIGSWQNPVLPPCIL
jgi:hypothetical protein